jgi:hypothetical protein
VEHPDNDSAIVASNELSPFLKAAYYNYTMAKK